VIYFIFQYAIRNKLCMLLEFIYFQDSLLFSQNIIINEKTIMVSILWHLLPYFMASHCVHVFVFDYYFHL